MFSYGTVKRQLHIDYKKRSMKEKAVIVHIVS